MVKRTGPTNIHLKDLIRELKKLSRKENVNIWRAIALKLEKSSRQRISVNISKIDRYSKDNETIIVPGKVLGTGSLTKKVIVSAFQFSESAKKKLKDFISIKELMKKNPKGKNIRIIG